MRANSTLPDGGGRDVEESWRRYRRACRWGVTLGCVVIVALGCAVAAGIALSAQNVRTPANGFAGMALTTLR